jgi:hypothetical protein
VLVIECIKGRAGITATRVFSTSIEMTIIGWSSIRWEGELGRRTANVA